jgi:hypothetical protein
MENTKMNYDLEIMVEADMIENGYNPRIWADVVEYWNEKLNND